MEGRTGVNYIRSSIVTSSSAAIPGWAQAWPATIERAIAIVAAIVTRVRVRVRVRAGGAMRSKNTGLHQHIEQVMILAMVHAWHAMVWMMA